MSMINSNSNGNINNCHSDGCKWCSSAGTRRPRRRTAQAGPVKFGTWCPSACLAVVDGGVRGRSNHLNGYNRRPHTHSPSSTVGCVIGQITCTCIPDTYTPTSPSSTAGCMAGQITWVVTLDAHTPTSPSSTAGCEASQLKSSNELECRTPAPPSWTAGCVPGQLHFSDELDGRHRRQISIPDPFKPPHSCST